MRQFNSSLILLALGLLFLVTSALPVQAQTAVPSGYKKWSELFGGSDFTKGRGTLYVDPETLPVGPHLAYDREGNLVSSAYMILLKDIDAHKRFDNLVAAHEKVDHVEIYYTGGHRGIAEPHYDIFLWYISPEQKARLK
jgi:hypothetical protein